MAAMVSRDVSSSGRPWAKFKAHGDPFPLAPSWVETDLKLNGDLFPRRGAWTARSLNNLALHSPNSDFDDLLRGSTPNQAQRAVVSRISEAISEAGPQPSDLDPLTALTEVTSSKDLYQEEPANLAPFEFSKVKVLHTDLKPQNLDGLVPRFVRGIRDRFETMIERPASDLAKEGTCQIKPYWDPTLRRSPKKLTQLIIRLSQKGLVSFRTGIKERIGIFCVRKKTPEWIRLIIDARRANWSHQPPPTTRLSTPRSLMDVQYHKRGDGPLAFGMEADVSDCFYNFINEKTASWFGVDLPMTCGHWKKLGWGGGPVFSDETQSFFTPADDQTLFPVFRGLCMGWAWALFLANEAVAFIVSGRIERPLQEVRDRLPPPDLQNHVITGVYVDNISIVGEGKEGVCRARDSIVEGFDRLGIPLTWSSEEPSSVLTTVGVIFDFEKGVARNKPRRIWRAFLAGREILRRRRVSVKMLETWLGHMTSLFMLAPAGLSCFSSIYRLIHDSHSARVEVWPSVREEIRNALGLIWLSRTSLSFDPVRQVDAGDSSGSAFALLTTWCNVSEIAEACRYRELWRFRALPQNIKDVISKGDRSELVEALEALQEEGVGPISRQELKPTSQFGAGLSSQFASWLTEAGDKDSWLRTSAISSQLRAKPSKRSMVEVPAIVPPLRDDMCNHSRFSLLWRRRWRGQDAGHITWKEARVALSSLKRTCRTSCLHGRLKLTLTDNLSCLSAFEKGRAVDPRLNSLCQVAASYSMGCGIRWRLRHIETKRNPADRDSRFDQGFRAPGHFPFDRGKHSRKPNAKFEQTPRSSGGEAGGVKAGALPIFSTCSVRAACRSTADHGRVPAQTPKVDIAFGPEKLSASMKLAKKLMNPSPTKTRQRSLPGPTEEAKPLVPGNDSSASQTPGLERKTKGFFLELFAGSGRLTQAVRDCGGATLAGVEIKQGGHFDLRRRSTQLVVLSWIKSGRVSVVHLGTPCTVFSRARHFIRNKVRAAEKERVGVELALFSAEVIQTCERYSVKWSLENPRNSRLFEMIGLAKLLAQQHVHRVEVDYCMYGERFRKPTSIFTNIPELDLLSKRCCHRKHEETLRGSERIVVDGISRSQPKTVRAGAYPQRLVRNWAQRLGDRVSKHSSVLGLLEWQWENELKQAMPRQSILGEPIQTASGLFFFNSRLEEKFRKAKDNIVFGQHTNQEVKRKQGQLQKIIGGDIQRFNVSRLVA